MVCALSRAARVAKLKLKPNSWSKLIPTDILIEKLHKLHAELVSENGQPKPLGPEATNFLRLYEDVHIGMTPDAFVVFHYIVFF
jgi:hypothetical protein